VFLGPSCVFTNVAHPRAHVSRKAEFQRTLVCRGATVGANATIVCGVTIGEYAMIGAGAVVLDDVPQHALVVGVPAARIGWACRCGATLAADLACGACGNHYVADRDAIALDPTSHTTMEDKTIEHHVFGVELARELIARAGQDPHQRRTLEEHADRRLREALFDRRDHALVALLPVARERRLGDEIRDRAMRRRAHDVAVVLDRD